MASDAHRMSLLDLIETEEAQRNLNNTMVRQLGGHMLDKPVDMPALLDQAKETLREAAWVGLHDHLPQDLDRLAHLLGLDMPNRRDNVTPNRSSYLTEDPRVLDRLYALNGFDLQLWHWANSLRGP